MTELFAPHPAKRAVERYWLRYTVAWGLVAAVVMLSGLAQRWGDAELLLLGAVLALGAIVPPILRPDASDAGRPWHERTASKMVLVIVGLAFGMNYFCTPYFFDVLHMHFGFDTRLNIRNNPVFLYLMTVAYFATYSVLVSMATRLARRLQRPWRTPVTLLMPFAVAFLETVLNANPFMTSLFCFDDVPLMLWFGTFSYGACFVVALPLWIGIDEHEDRRQSLAQVAVATLAALMAIVIVFELLRYGIAPHVTSVVDGASGLRDYAGSCLERP